MNNPIEVLKKDDIEIIIRPEDGYVNLTALCKRAGKEFKAYHRTETTKQFLIELSRLVNISTDLLIQVLDTGPNECRGTWAHRRVAINCAQWISAKYAAIVTEIVEEYHEKGIVIDKSKNIKSLDLFKHVLATFEEQEVRLSNVEASTIKLEHKHNILENSLTIDPYERGELKELVDKIEAISPTLHWATIWKTFNNRFGIASYSTLPKKRFAEAKEFLEDWYTNESKVNTIPDQVGLFEDSESRWPNG